MVLTLNTIPGYSDLPDARLVAGQPTFALHIGHINSNANFSMVRFEVFKELYKDGETVILPTSTRDGYAYTRDELIYVWTVRHSGESLSGWISGPDSLWFCNWKVDQDTGAVHSQEWYRRSGDHDQNASSHDGTLLVFTIAQRQKDSLIMATAATYNAIDEADIDVDKPLTQELAQALNRGAKFAMANTEAIYMGEFTDGQTVPHPTSPIDGNVYAYSECRFGFSWRWTTLGSAYTQPPKDYGQLGPFTASINPSTGVVDLSVTFIGFDSINITPAGYGRIAVVAYCTRVETPSSGDLADDFTEQDPNFFVPGRTLRGSTALAIKKNIDEGTLTPEFFGPTEYGDGDTVPLPVSDVDGYEYVRTELTYVYDWSDTTNQTGTHLRIPFFAGYVNATTGVVVLNVWRLPPGGPYVDDNNTFARISVLVIAHRQAEHPSISAGDDGNPPDDAGTFTTDAKDPGFYVNGN